MGLAMLALLAPRPVKPPKEPKLLPPGSKPAALAARWVEEGVQSEWRILLRPNGRAAKWRYRKCLETPETEKCLHFKYEGTWEANGRVLTLHLPGGMDERFRYSLAGHVLTLTDAKGQKLSFVYQLLDAEGQGRPQGLVGMWSEKARTIAINADGSYSDRDEDSETKGTWRADSTRLTLLPKGEGEEDITYLYRIRAASLVLQDATGRARTLRAVR